ncbi:MAG: hypothetical protein QWI73_05235 [Alphaproteobacteria bacterium]|nr:hypothetical protein [Alphaproteobacteria bacterium]
MMLKKVFEDDNDDADEGDVDASASVESDERSDGAKVIVLRIKVC